MTGILPSHFNRFIYLLRWIGGNVDVVFFPVKNGREESLNSDTNFFYTFHLIAKPMIKLTIIIYFHHLYAKEESVQSYFFIFFRSRYTYLIKLLQSKFYFIKQFTCLYCVNVKVTLLKCILLKQQPWLCAPFSTGKCFMLNLSIFF